METKLTLRLDKETVERAKTFAQQNNTSLSKLVEKYFRSIQDRKTGSAYSSSIVNSLQGIVSEQSYEEVKKEYHENRIKKHSSRR